MISNDLSIGSSITAPSGVVIATPSGSTRPISLGAEVTNQLSLTDTELDFISVGTLDIGTTTSLSPIHLSGVVTGSSYNVLSLKTKSAVLDQSAGEQTDLQVASLAIRSGAGVGQTDDLDIATSSLAIANSLSPTVDHSDIDIRNSGSLTISTSSVDGLVGITNSALGSGDVRLTTVGTLTLDSSIALSNSGSIQLTAVGATSSILVNQPLVTIGAEIRLTADDDVSLASSGDLSTSGGNLFIRADADNVANGTSGSITLVGGTYVDSGSGTISLRADEDIRVTGLVTANATSSAVTIVSSSGRILSGGSTHQDIQANSAGAITTLQSSTGVGLSNSALDLNVSSLVTLSSGAQYLNEIDGVLDLNLDAGLSAVSCRLVEV